MRILIVLASLALAGLAVADPCPPARQPAKHAAYTAPFVAHTTPFVAHNATYVQHGQAVHAREILIAEAAFVPVNFQAFDLFVFYGAPLISPQPTLGIDPQGRELKVLPAASLQPQPQPQSQVQPGPQPLSGYEVQPGQPQVLPAQQPRGGPPESLRTSCASCHSRQTKLRGDFALFDAQGNFEPGVNWKAVLEEVQAGRMPPGGSGKPAIPQADVDAIRALAR